MTTDGYRSDQTYTMRRPVHAANLREGDRVRYLGSMRTVSGVHRSLGNGWAVTFSDGPAANFVGTVYVQR